MKNVVLYFGSFNPIHTAHLAIASHMTTLADEVWLVLSPHNPLKDGATLASENHRLQMAIDAVQSINHSEKIRICKIEFVLPRPSYTFKTLRALREAHPYNLFSMVMGTDNLQEIEQWKNYKEILEQTKIYVYPREGYTITPEKYTDYNITYLENVVTMPTSSTKIRTSPQHLTDVLPITKEYITKHNLYE